MHLLCRNTVKDYAVWRKIFDADAEAHREAGLLLERIWRDSDAPDTVFFIFEVRDQAKAKAFLDAPDAKQHAERAGVTDGAFHFLDEAPGY